MGVGVPYTGQKRHK